MECEILFLGFGPITYAFAKNLIDKGHKVVVITERFNVNEAKLKLSSNSLTMLNWKAAINHEIFSETTYIGWRETPKNYAFGDDLIKWIKSSNMDTRKIHHLGSASVYVGDRESFSESDYDFRTKEVEKNSKQDLEQLVFEISEKKMTAFVNYRISNVYGSGLNQGFINESINNIKSKKPIQIFKQLDLVRDYLTIDDLIEALTELRMNSFTYETLNLSSGNGVAVSEIVSKFEEMYSSDLKFIEVEAPEGLLRRSVLSTERLQRIIPWKPTRVQESLRIMMQDLNYESREL